MKKNLLVVMAVLLGCGKSDHSSQPPTQAPLGASSGLDGSASSQAGVPTKTEAESIGMAELAQDGTITLTLRAAGPGMVGDGRLVYPPNHAQYEIIKKHIGPIKPGEQKPVAPFPEP